MPYRVEYRGRKIECDTPEEAMRIADMDAAGSKGKGVVRTASASPETPAATVTATATSSSTGTSSRLLQVVKGAGDHGVLNETLVTALGLQGGRGLGPLMQALKKDLAALGMQPSDVVDVKREGKRRRWFRAGRIDDALRGLGAA